MTGLELARGQAAQPAELPVRRKPDLVQQVETAGRADPVRDLTERVTAADDSELERPRLLTALDLTAWRHLLDRVLSGAVGCPPTASRHGDAQPV
jgi:hypothetical protein